MRAATVPSLSARLHSVILAGPPSNLSDRVAGALRSHGLTVLRARAISDASCEALGGVDGCAIVVVAQTSEIADESCQFNDARPPAPTLRVIGGRLMSASCPNSDVAGLMAALAGAGVSLGAAMGRALNLLE